MAPKSKKNAKQIQTNQRKRNAIKKKSKYFVKSKGNNEERIKKAPQTRDINPESGPDLSTLPPTVVDEIPTIIHPGLFAKRLCRNFFDTPTEKLAVALLGKVLCRITEQGEKLRGMIVETEAYLGETDPACHSYEGRRTQRNEATYGPPGTAYVYFIYGMYHCFNISSKENGACVLIRALEPVQGHVSMRKLRGAKRKETSKMLKDHELANGPSKLCTAMNITRDSLNNTDLDTSKIFWVEDTATTEFSVIHTTRIGIESYGKESALKPYRYYILGNKHVSSRDKMAEKKLDCVNDDNGSNARIEDAQNNIKI